MMQYFLFELIQKVLDPPSEACGPLYVRSVANTTPRPYGECCGPLFWAPKPFSLRHLPCWACTVLPSSQMAEMCFLPYTLEL